MSVLCGAECVMVLGCTRWLWRRCTHVGSDDSDSWPLATPDEFDPVPRLCRLILAVYEPDLRIPECVVKRVSYEQTLGRAPPYLIYLDHQHRDIVLAVRGLNLVKESDYELLLDNKLGMQMFDGGYVHHGLLKSAIWLLNQEGETLKRLWLDNGAHYNMVFVGHSLGSGVVSLLTLILVNHRDLLGGIPRTKIRCYALAPARCMSLNLAVKYADVIHSVVLQVAKFISRVVSIICLIRNFLLVKWFSQDDFLPRTATPLEDIFKSIFWLLFSFPCPSIHLNCIAN